MKSLDGGFEVDVESDSLLDACALCVGPMPCSERPWSTRHVVIEPGPEHFAVALRDVVRSGFSVQRTSISHCSKAQWLVELHGVNMGIPLNANVGLWTTLAATREIHARLSFQVSNE